MNKKRNKNKRKKLVSNHNNDIDLVETIENIDENFDDLDDEEIFKMVKKFETLLIQSHPEHKTEQQKLSKLQKDLKENNQ